MRIRSRRGRRAAAIVTLALMLGGGLPARAAAQTPRGALSLQAATDALLARNLSVMAARYNVDLFRAQRITAALKPDPTIVVAATQLTIPRVLSHPSYAGVATPDDAILDTQYMVDVEKLVERGGKRARRVTQADIETTAAEAALADEVRQRTFELRQAFLSALLARENARVFDENLRDFERMREVFSSQVADGYTAGVDLRRIGLELVGIQGNVSAARTDYAQAVRDVRNLIGDGGDAPAATGSPDTARPEAPDGFAADGSAADDALEGDLSAAPVSLDLEALRRLALANRPDLRAAQLTVDAAAAALAVAEAGRARDVTLGTQYLRSGPDNAVGVAVGVPLTTARRADAAIAQATSARLQAESRLGQAHAQVLTDVDKAFVAYRMSRDRLQLFDGQILRQAAEVRDIEQIAYREGERGLLDFLDAQRAYNQTLVSYNEARYALAASVSRLEAATGASAAALAGTADPGDSHD